MKRGIALALALCLLAAAGCGRIVPIPGPSETPEAVPTVTPGSDAAPTPEPTEAPTPGPTPTPTPEPTLGPTPTPAPTPTPTPTPEPTPTPTPMTTPTPTPTPQPTPAPEPTPEPSAKPGFDLSPGLFDGGLERLELPSDSGEYSVRLALRAQALCAAQDRETARQLLESAGFTVVKQVHYDKPASDRGHTCAWTLGKKEIDFGGVRRTLLLVTVRGTSGGEWYSNFDFAPSHDEDTCYAENFLACANDVLEGLREDLEAEERPLLLICGHSRGAACANLLGALLDEERGPEDIYVYTFATPTTLRGEALEREYPNIFNLLNPCDIVTMLPLPSLGYGRAGRDIVLPNDREAAQVLRDRIGSLGALIPSITDYYTAKHSLTGPGLSEDGMTPYELFCAVAGVFAEDGGVSLFTGGSPLTIAPDSDYAPLMGLLTGAGEAGSAQALNVAMQHTPVTYMALLTASAMFG